MALHAGDPSPAASQCRWRGTVLGPIPCRRDLWQRVGGQEDAAVSGARRCPTLLREAPIAAPCKYWLFNDNALAGHLLASLGHPLATTLLGELQRYGHATNGLHEILWGVRAGETRDWQPRTL